VVISGFAVTATVIVTGLELDPELAVPDEDDDEHAASASEPVAMASTVTVPPRLFLRISTVLLLEKAPQGLQIQRLRCGRAASQRR
jgi:hypothetical protein